MYTGQLTKTIIGTIEKIFYAIGDACDYLDIKLKEDDED
jgi:hypothetical protein